MIIVNFDKNELCKKAYGLWQYDYGQVLRIQGLNLPTAAEIHFALQETGGEAVTRIGITKDGVTDVTIPDSLLEADGASQDYQIYVFVYLATPESGETTRRITLGVKSRPRPEAFEAPGDGELFEEAIQAVNDAAKRAEDAGKEASAAAGEAKESASLAGKYLTDTQTLAEQVEINADLVVQGKEEAARLLTQTQEAASNAALSAETAKQSETAAKQAQTAAETAEDTARQYAEETEADRQEVAESKQSVTQMKSDISRMQADVQANREAVEQTVTEFRTAAQGALTAIRQAQNTAVSAVQTEGRKQATAVRETGTQAVNEVETAKTAAVGAVTSEGDKQVVRVQEAAAEIVADREQIQQNKTDITTLTNKTNTLAPGIVLDAKGGAIAVSNASEQPLVGLNVYGKSEQVQTTGAQIWDNRAAMKPEFWSGEKGYKYAKLNLKPNTTYTLSVGQNNMHKDYKAEYVGEFAFYIGETPGVASPNLLFGNTNSDIKVTEKSFTTTDKPFYFNLFCGKWNAEYIKIAFTELLQNIMLVEGGVAKPYEPYTGGKPSPSPEYPQEITSAGDNGTLEVKIRDSAEQSQRLIVQTPNGLPGIPVKSGGNYTDETGQQWVCDEIDMEREVRIQRVIKLTFDGSDDEDWAIYNNTNYSGFMTGNVLPEIPERKSGYCNIAEVKTNSSAIITNGIWLGVNNARIYYANNPFYDDSLEDKGLANWKAYLAENPMEVITYVTTPVETHLTPEEIAAYKSLRTYSGTTVVTNDSGAGMSLTYTVDTKKYVDKKIAAISAAMIGG